MGEYDEEALPPEGLSGPNLAEEVRAGQKFAAFRNSDVYRDVSESMRSSTLAVFEITPLRDTDGLIYCRMMLQVLADMDRLLVDAIDSGMLSAKQIEQSQSKFGESK